MRRVLRWMMFCILLYTTCLDMMVVCGVSIRLTTWVIWGGFQTNRQQQLLFSHPNEKVETIEEYWYRHYYYYPKCSHNKYFFSDTSMGTFAVFKFRSWQSNDATAMSTMLLRTIAARNSNKMNFLSLGKEIPAFFVFLLYVR